MPSKEKTDLEARVSSGGPIMPADLVEFGRHVGENHYVLHGRLYRLVVDIEGGTIITVRVREN